MSAVVVELRNLNSGHLRPSLTSLVLLSCSHSELKVRLQQLLEKLKEQEREM